MKLFSPFRLIVLTSVFGLTLLLWQGIANTEETETDVEKVSGVPAAVQDAMQDRDYPAAIEAIDKAVAAKNGPVDYMLYLKGRALHHQKKYTEAVAVFEGLVSDYPSSRWQRRATFAKGAALARKGDFHAAEIVYREQAELLLRPERKHEVAGICLEFADAFFKPTDSLKKPDYDRARKFYEKAIEIGPKPLRLAEVEVRIGRCFEEMNNWQGAAQHYANFVKKYKETKLKIDDLRLEATYRLGASQLAMKQHREARRTWQDLIASDLAKKATSKESKERLAKAWFRIAETHGAPSPNSGEDIDLAIASLDRFIEKHPSHKLASKAHLWAIECLRNGRRYEAATVRISSFLKDKRYSKTEEMPQASLILGDCFARQKQYDKAIVAWKSYLSKYPAHKGWSVAQQSIINAEYYRAAEASRKKDYKQAKITLDAVPGKIPAR